MCQKHYKKIFKNMPVLCKSNCGSKAILKVIKITILKEITLLYGFFYFSSRDQKLAMRYARTVST